MDERYELVIEPAGLKIVFDAEQGLNTLGGDGVRVESLVHGYTSYFRVSGHIEYGDPIRAGTDIANIVGIDAGSQAT
jgi:hypothetical protein